MLLAVLADARHHLHALLILMLLIRHENMSTWWVC